MRYIFLFSLFLYCALCFSQDATYTVVEVSYDRVVMLHFDYRVHKAWPGNEEMISIKKEDDKLILLAKKENEDFVENNLQVQTVDGAFFVFALKFNNKPAQEFFHFVPKQAVYRGKPLVTPDSVAKGTPSLVASSQTREDELEIKALAKIVEAKETSPTGLAAEERKMQFLVGGIYVKDNLLFFKVLVGNSSNIAYDVDFVRFVVQPENTKVKRTAKQDEGKKVKYVLGEERKKIVKGNIVTMVFVFDKFTIDKHEKLYIEFWELNGDRNIRIAVPNKSILAAKAL